MVVALIVGRKKGGAENVAPDAGLWDDSTVPRAIAARPSHKSAAQQSRAVLYQSHMF